MKLVLLCCAAALAFAGPIAPDHHAILGQDYAKGAVGDPVASQVITRAEAALTRPAGAIPRLHTEGTLPGKGIREISLKAKEDQPIILNLALAWRLTGDRRFLDQAGRYLEAWADIYQMSFNPIDETGFDSLILATDLTEADLPPALQAKLDGFWRRMAEGYLDAMRGKPKHFYTNWQSHRVKLATMAAFQVGDSDLIARAGQAFQAQVATNILANGSVFDFQERDALHYVTYDLDPLLVAALAAKAHGEDWYSWKNPAGASLRSALAWLEPYARGEKTHIEFARSTIQFDLDRAKAGQGEYAPHPWDAGNSVGTYALAALCDPQYKALAEQLAARSGRKPQAWIVLLAR